RPGRVGGGAIRGSSPDARAGDRVTSRATRTRNDQVTHRANLRTRGIVGLVACLALLAGVACGSRSGNEDRDRRENAAAATDRGGAASRTDVSHNRIGVLGDSLTAGLGLSLKDSFPTQLQNRINDAGLDYTIVNAGVSGDTSAGGLSRLDWALDGDVRV